MKYMLHSRAISMGGCQVTEAYHGIFLEGK